MRQLTLFIPGLLGPNIKLAMDDLPATTHLDKLLARAKQARMDASGFTSILFNLFGLNQTTDADHPVAAVTRLVDDGCSPGETWMRADPVHLSAEHKGVTLLDHTTLKINRHDALATAADIGTVFEARKMNLEVPIPTRWYLRVQNPPRIKTSEIAGVIGRNIHPYLPTGEDQTEIIRLLNEVQMILHSSEINIDRQHRGLLPINGVWLWGLGQLPESIETKWSAVYTDEEVARGLSILAGTPVFDLPDTIAAVDTEADHFLQLAVISTGLHHVQYQDPDGWTGFLQHLEAQWFTELYELLDAGVFDRVEIITGHLSFKLRRFSLLKFWREDYIHRVNQLR